MSSSFTMEKRMSIGNVITIVVVLIGGLFTYAQMQGRVEMLQADLQRITLEVARRADQFDDVQSRLIRVEEKLANQTDLLRQISETLKNERRQP